MHDSLTLRYILTQIKNYILLTLSFIKMKKFIITENISLII